MDKDNRTGETVEDSDQPAMLPPDIAPTVQMSDPEGLSALATAGLVEDIGLLTDEQIEDIEKLTLRWIFQAALDFGMEAHTIFLNSPDDVKDVAEDITRELLDRLPGYNVPQRIYGTVDYKRARYIVLPSMIVRQALFVDSKAEQENRTATIQMSQTSMHIRQMRGGIATDEVGMLPLVSEYNSSQYLTTTAFLHFKYSDKPDGRHHLQAATIFCLPNGRLQGHYNPIANDTIWLVGRNAPTRGEDFRVRVSFHSLSNKARWRVQTIRYNEISAASEGNWSE